jgi:hypothetical protein
VTAPRFALFVTYSSYAISPLITAKCSMGGRHGHCLRIGERSRSERLPGKAGPNGYRHGFAGEMASHPTHGAKEAVKAAGNQACSKLLSGGIFIRSRLPISPHDITCDKKEEW